MILECPECHTRYLIPDTAIGADGRTVRCATCKHSWFQAAGPVLDLVAQAEAVSAPVPTQPPAPAQAQATPLPVTVESAPPVAEPDDDAVAPAPPFRPRRNPAKRWTIAAIAAGLVMLVGVGGILSSGASGLASDLFAPATQTPLKLISKPVDRHDYNGNEVFAISGTVLNPTNTRQRVPDIRADLRDAQKRIVFSWIIRPEESELPPGGKVDFNSAKLDVPINARELVLSFSGETAH